MSECNDECKKVKDMKWDELLGYLVKSYLLPGAGDYIASIFVEKAVSAIFPNEVTMEGRLLDAIKNVTEQIGERIQEEDLREYIAFCKNIKEQFYNFYVTKDNEKLDYIEEEAQKVVSLLESLGRKGLVALEIAYCLHLLVIKAIGIEYKTSYRQLLLERAKIYQSRIQERVKMMLEEERKWLGPIEYMEGWRSISDEAYIELQSKYPSIPKQDMYLHGFYFFRVGFGREMRYADVYTWCLVEYEKELLELEKRNIEEKWKRCEETELKEHMEVFNRIGDKMLSTVANFEKIDISIET